MGVILNKQEIARPLLNGQQMNAYLNGEKVWKSKGRYYNGYVHDLPEPDWEGLANILPTGCQLWRDIDGYWYHNAGYLSTTVYKRTPDLQLIGSVSVTSQYNRNMPYIITNYNDTQSDCIVFPNYNGATPPAVWTKKEPLTSLIPQTFSAGAFHDKLGNQSNAIAVGQYGGFGAGSAVYLSNGECLMYLGGMMINPNFKSAEAFSNLMSTYQCLNNQISGIIFYAGDGYMFALNYSNNLLIFNWGIFESTGDFDAAFITQVASGIVMNNKGYDAAYVYNGRIVIVGFDGDVRVFNSQTGAVLNSYSLGGTDSAKYFWRNKIYNSYNKTVTTINL
jgi:hypothetical protein